MSLRWAKLTIGALEAAGVTDAVVCPGSRSAPLAVAAASSGLRVTSVIDERSAGFFALGQARASGRPAAVICTSGTAGAHFYPAVIEASAAAVPMLLVTADRPGELHGCGAPQTIDQRDLFGSFVRRAVDLGCARQDAGAERALVGQLAAAVAAAVGPHPGPVHLNAPARKPLLDATRCDAPAPAPVLISAPRLEPDPGAIAEVAARLQRARRPLCIAGPMATGLDTSGLIELCARLEMPLLAEAASQARFTSGAPGARVSFFDDILRENGAADNRDDHPLRPDLIVEVGAPPTSAGYARTLAADPGITRVALRPHVHADPHGSIELEIIGDLRSSIGLLAAATEAVVVASSFAAAWRRADAEVAAAIERDLGGEVMTGQAAARCIVAHLPANAQLALGNSLPIRWVDQACPAGTSFARVLHQRGVCGIDGLIAGAAGAASATGSPTCLLLGDVSLAHDVGSLAVARSVEAPLVLCVFDNGGGQIFSELPYANELPADTRDQLFATPPRLEMLHAARAFGIRAVEVATLDSLAGAVDRAFAVAGPTLIRAIVAQRSRPVL